ncbi:hypothetical protein [Streptomyces mangrovisoli]|uniref:Uncharacterized protein n=1 Tax=Streptomyces mangrovisoli TaxID=1428628 RepID=A0A1J4NM80_9ACTN|nr:hypothetical protein [Streptomyces mangrovisoli]OIJ63411.1 hypothetical protein WN71_034160 [Streptomyces mangrovisoli]
MRSCHAVEIVLTRPVALDELRRLGRGVPLAASSDRTRLMAVQPARSAAAALRGLRRRLEGRLPVDVLHTHYPDSQGLLLLDVDLGPDAEQVLSMAAAASGFSVAEVLRRRVLAALARVEDERARHLQENLDSLLTRHSPEEILVCMAARCLGRSAAQTP